MADAVKLSVTGLAELQASLAALSNRSQGNVERKAVRAASSPLLQEYRRNLRTVGRKTGRLRVAAARVIRKLRGANAYAAIVGASGSWAAPHAHLIEYGTAPRYTGSVARKSKTGTYKKPTGHKRAYRGQVTESTKGFAPFRRAYDKTIGLVRQLLFDAIAKGIDDEVRKAARR